MNIVPNCYPQGYYLIHMKSPLLKSALKYHRSKTLRCKFKFSWALTEYGRQSEKPKINSQNVVLYKKFFKSATIKRFKINQEKGMPHVCFPSYKLLWFSFYVSFLFNY